MWCWESGASFLISLLGRALSRRGNVLPDLDSAGDDSLSWSLAVGVVVSAFLFWLFLCWEVVKGSTERGERKHRGRGWGGRERKTVQTRRKKMHTLVGGTIKSIRNNMPLSKHIPQPPSQSDLL